MTRFRPITLRVSRLRCDNIIYSRLQAIIARLIHSWKIRVWYDGYLIPPTYHFMSQYLIWESCRTSPMRYLRLFQGNLESLLSWAFERYVLNMSMHTWKSDSLKSYETFQPIFPYFRRSWTTAWKKLRTKTSEEKAGWGQSVNVAGLILKYVLRMLSLRPFGGSVTTCEQNLISKVWDRLVVLKLTAIFSISKFETVLLFLNNWRTIKFQTFDTLWYVH